MGEHQCAEETTNQHNIMTSLNSRMQLDLLNRKKGRNLLEKGFTLVELMIVIVIVGILSAVALPNFLSQTSKAKGTEAKTLSASALKEAQVAWTENGAGGLTDWAPTFLPDGTGGQCPASTSVFDFVCLGNDPTAVTVTATGGDDAGDLQGETVIATVNVRTGGVVSYCGTAAGVPACGGAGDGAGG